MNKNDLAKVLAKLHFSAQLPETVQESLASSATVQRFPAGSVLFKEKSEVTMGHLLICLARPCRFKTWHVPERGEVRILALRAGRSCWLVGACSGIQ